MFLDSSLLTELPCQSRILLQVARVGLERQVLLAALACLLLLAIPWVPLAQDYPLIPQLHLNLVVLWSQELQVLHSCHFHLANLFLLVAQLDQEDPEDQSVLCDPWIPWVQMVLVHQEFLAVQVVQVFQLILAVPSIQEAHWIPFLLSLQYSLEDHFYQGGLVILEIQGHQQVQQFQGDPCHQAFQHQVDHSFQLDPAHPALL